MKFNTGDKLYQGWCIASCDILKSEYSMYSLKKVSDGQHLSSTLVIIPVHDENHKVRLEDNLTFLMENKNKEGILKIYEWTLDESLDPALFFIRLEECSPVSMMKLDEKQTIAMAFDLMKSLTLFKENYRFCDGLVPENVFLTPSGQYKIGDFVSRDEMSSFQRYNQDLCNLAQLMRSVLNPQTTLSPQMDNVLNQAENYAFSDHDQMIRALKKAADQKQNVRRKLLLNFFRSFLAVLVMGIFAAGFYGWIHKDTPDESLYSGLIHKDILDLTSQADARSTGWTPAQPVHNLEYSYGKEISGGRLALAYSSSAAILEMELLDETFDLQEATQALDTLMPDLDLETNMEDYLQTWQQVHQWLLEHGQEIPGSHTRTHVYTSDALYVSYEENSLGTRYVFSDYDCTITVESHLDAQLKPDRFTFSIHKAEA